MHIAKTVEMIFIEAYNNIGGGQRILKKLYEVYSKDLQGRGLFMLTAPSDEVYGFFGRECCVAVEYARFNAFGKLLNPELFLRYLMRVPWMFIYTARAVRKLREHKGDLIVLDVRALLFMLPVKWICQKKLFFYAVGGSPLPTTLNSMLIKMVDKAYFISSELSEEFGQRDGEVVFNSIDTAKWYPDVSAQLREFVYVGTISQQKGLHSIVECFIRSGRAATIDVYGAFPDGMEYYEDYLKSLVKNSVVTLNFLGAVENMNEVLRKYKYLLFGSLRHSHIVHGGSDYYAASSEGSPTVIIEAILSGLYVFASDSTGVYQLSDFLGNISIVDWEKFRFTDDVFQKAHYSPVSKDKIIQYDYKRNYALMLKKMR